MSEPIPIPCTTGELHQGGLLAKELFYTVDDETGTVVAVAMLMAMVAEHLSARVKETRDAILGRIYASSLGMFRLDALQ